MVESLGYVFSSWVLLLTLPQVTEALGASSFMHNDNTVHTYMV